MSNLSKPLVSLYLSFLRKLARLQLQKNRPIIIGVTGSAGKTSTVDAIAIVLKNKHHLKQTKKGNSQTGIPLEILNVPVDDYTGLQWIKVTLLALWNLVTNWRRYDVLVAEMGIDSDQPPQNMTTLLKIIQPSIGVFLNVGSVHGLNFAGDDTKFSIAREKGKLLLSLPQSGLAIYSADHPEIISLESKIKSAKQTFSIDKKSSLSLKKHQVSLKGTTFTFTYQQKSYLLNLANQLHFKESFGDFASSLLVGLRLGIDIKDGIKALESHFSLLPGRMTILAGINNSTLIDSSYNSSLEPTTAALKMLKSITHHGRKIAILGDMREIGLNEKEEHQKLARTAAANADLIILVGPLTKQHSMPELKKKGFNSKNLLWFENAYQAIDSVKNLIGKDDLVLIKGSQNTIFLEIIAEALMKHPEKAKVLLCRQTPYWEKQRRKLRDKKN